MKEHESVDIDLRGNWAFLTWALSSFRWLRNKPGAPGEGGWCGKGLNSDPTLNVWPWISQFPLLSLHLFLLVMAVMTSTPGLWGTQCSQGWHYPTSSVQSLPSERILDPSWGSRAGGERVTLHTLPQFTAYPVSVGKLLSICEFWFPHM